MSDLKAIVLITEGASLDVLDRWSAQHLPHFSQLRTGHPNGVMRSEFVPYEASGLVTAFTGHRPGAHGCYSYWDVHSAGYEPVVLDGASLRRSFLWHRKEFEHVPVAIVNVFGTHPVQPVNGYVISYPMRRTMHACHPRNLAMRLSRRGVSLVHDVTVWFTGGPRDEFVRQVLHADRQRIEATFALLDAQLGEAPRLTVLNLTSIDRLSHGYWHELEDDEMTDEDTALLQAYRQADEVIGRLMERVDEHTSLLVFSEIGFGGLRAFCSVNDALRDGGLLILGPTGQPEWGCSHAFEAVQGSHGVNLNMKSRYRRGRLDATQYDMMLTEVIDVLAESENPHTGRPLFDHVMSREEIHTGDAVEAAPDVILVPSDWSYLPLGDLFWSDKTNRHLQTGWHRHDSFWAGAGLAFGGGTAGGRGATIDIAPTITGMLGLPPISDFIGQRLGGRQ